MVVRDCHQVIQCAMDRVIPSGLDFDWQDAHCAAVIDKEVNLTFLLIVVVEQFIVMRLQLLGNSTFVYRTKINTGNIVQDRPDIVLIQLGTQHTDIIHIQLQQVFLQRFGQWIFRIADGIGCYRNA